MSLENHDFPVNPSSIPPDVEARYTKAASEHLRAWAEIAPLLTRDDQHRLCAAQLELMVELALVFSAEDAP